MGRRAVLKSAVTTATTPPAAHFTPRTFTNQTLAASRGCCFWWSLIPGLTTSLSWRCCMLTHGHCALYTDSRLCPVDTDILAARRKLTQWVWGYGCCPVSSACIWYHPGYTPVEGHASPLLLQRGWRDGKEWAGCAEKATRRNVRVNGPLQLPSSQLRHLRLQTGLKVQAPLPCPAGPAEDGRPQPPLWTGQQLSLLG